MIQKIKWFIQGNRRKALIETWFSFFIPKHIREQYKYRLQNANPVCIKNKQCIGCGCTVPAVFLADKSCKRGCYPVMLTRRDWKLFKLNNNINI